MKSNTVKIPELKNSNEAREKSTAKAIILIYEWFTLSAKPTETMPMIT